MLKREKVCKRRYEVDAETRERVYFTSESAVKYGRDMIKIIGPCLDVAHQLSSFSCLFICMFGFSSVCSWAHSKRGILQVWEILIHSPILIMVDLCKYNNHTNQNLLNISNFVLSMCPCAHTRQTV